MVISNTIGPLRIPTVPNSMPVCHTRSAQPWAISSTASGSASVARSRSLCGAAEKHVPDRPADQGQLIPVLGEHPAEFQRGRGRRAQQRRGGLPLRGPMDGVSGTGIEGRGYMSSGGNPGTPGT